MLAEMKSIIYILLSISFLIACGSTQQQTESSTDKIEQLDTKLIRSGRIWSLDWSPNGKYIACGNSSALLKIYDAKTLELVNVLTGFTATINGIHFSPDGTKIIACGAHEDPRIMIWDLEQKTRTIITDHTRQVRSVRWSPKGEHFASTSHDGTIRIWTPKGEFVTMFTGADFGCVGIDWLDENKIVASCWDNTIRTYTLSRTDSLLIENGNHRQKAVLSVDWHPNGKIFATGDYGNEGDTVHAVKIWSFDGDLQAQMTSHELEIRSLAWNKSGELLATGGETIRLWNQKGDLLKIFDDNKSPVWCLDWNADGTEIVSGHNDGKLRIWNTKGELLRMINGHSSETTAMAFSQDSTQLLVGFSDGILRYFDLNTMTTHTVQAHRRSITNIAWSSDENHVAISGNEDISSIWTIKNGQLSNHPIYFGKGLGIKYIAWNSDNQSVAYLDYNNVISIFNTNGALQNTVKSNKEINTIIWKNNQPIGSEKPKMEFVFNSKIMVQKDRQQLELIPLNKNRFALVDDDRNLFFGDKEDFVKLIEMEEGFMEIKAISTKGNHNE